MRWVVVAVGSLAISGCALIGYDPRGLPMQDSGTGEGLIQPANPTRPDAGVASAPGNADASASISDAIAGSISDDAGVSALPLAADGGLAPMQISCGPLACSTANGGGCCVTDYPGYPTAPALSGFRCEADGADCAFDLRCDSADDCSGDDVCCLDSFTDPPESACASECQGLGEAPIECTSKSDCPANQHCCGDLTALTDLRYQEIVCSETCEGVLTIRFCQDDSDCLEPDTCVPSSIVPGRAICN